MAHISNIVAKLPHQFPGWNDLKKDIEIVATGDFKHWTNKSEVFPSYPVLNDDSLSSYKVFISKIALEIEILFPESVPLLLCPHDGEVVMTQRQVLCLLCHAFLDSFGPCEFDGQRLSLVSWKEDIEKLKCFMAYLEEYESRIRGDLTWIGSRIAFSRRSYSPINSWLTCNNTMSQVIVADDVSECIERSIGSLHADFANEYIGGGVLHGGCVQEEIRFTICPEALVSLLLCDRMSRTDSILIRGTEQFSAYSGYGRSFRFSGKFVDTNQIVDGFRLSAIVALDAIPYFVNNNKKQYSQRNTEDEINKCLASVARWPYEMDSSLQPFSTGNWGCGVFGGNPQYKFLIQWIACSTAERNMTYFPYGDPRMVELGNFVTGLQDVKDIVTVAVMVEWTLDFCHHQDSAESVFSFIRDKMERLNSVGAHLIHKNIIAIPDVSEVEYRKSNSDSNSFLPFLHTFSSPKFLVCLAPMVRVGGAAFRALCLSYGADKVWSEEIIDKRIAACNRIENKQLGTIDFVISRSVGNRHDAAKDDENDSNNAPVIFRTDPSVEKSKVIFQMGSSCAEDALAAALVVHNDVAGIDINMGCPKKFSVQGGMGAALLQNPDTACSIISTLRNHIMIPVTAKIRLLDSLEKTIVFMRQLEAAGASGITVHLRQRETREREPANWDDLKTLVQCVSIPVIANGDFYDFADMQRVASSTGCAGFMLARPVLLNPSVLQFRESKRYIPLQIVIRTFLNYCVRYETPYQLVKYTLMEMMNSGRHTRVMTEKMKIKGLEFGRLEIFEAVQSSRSLVEIIDIVGVSNDIINVTGIDSKRGSLSSLSDLESQSVDIKENCTVITSGNKRSLCTFETEDSDEVDRRNIGSSDRMKCFKLDFDIQPSI